MMAAEGPFLAAVIARLPDPTFNLAAYGVTLAFAFMIEAPVVMLLTASTALASDRDRYRRLLRFAYGLNGLVTLVLLVVVTPPVFDVLARDLVAVPDRVADLTYTSLWILLPWPASVGYRRFYQGLLIRDGRTRLVAVGTVIRLTCMAGTALVLFGWADVPGAYVGAAALSGGVFGEALASRWMARGSVSRLLATPAPPDEDELDTARIARFYLPLALTSLIGFAVHPMLTFFMGRAPEPVRSLAVFPVVNSLSFLFRSAGLAFQEVSIAMMGPRFRHLPELRVFTGWMGLVSSALLALVAFTPLVDVWYGIVSGLSPDLVLFAIVPTILLVPMPFLSFFLALFRGVQVTADRTRAITMATILEVAAIAMAFPILAAADMNGVTAATAAFLAGRTTSVTFLLVRSRRSVRELGAP